MGLFDVLSGVTGRGEGAGSAPDARTGDGSEGERAVGRDPGDLSPTDFRDRAETLAGRSDVPELDFSGEALADLDSMAGSHPVDDVVTYGSYLGETLVREYDGEWVRDGGWRVAVALGDDETTVAVFDAARMSLEQGPVFAQVGERLHAQGDPYATGTRQDEAVDDEASSIDGESEEEEAPEVTDDAAAAEPPADDRTDEDEDDSDRADEVETETEPSDDAESTTEIESGSEAPSETDTAAAVETDTAADAETSVDEAGVADEQTEAPACDPTTDDGGVPVAPATTTPSPDEGRAPDESETVAAIDADMDEPDESVGETDADVVSNEDADANVAGDPEPAGNGERSSIIDARSSDLGVGPDGPTEADFAGDPFDRPSSAATGVDPAESVDDAIADAADSESIDDEPAIENPDIDEDARADRESDDPGREETTTSDEEDVPEAVDDAAAAEPPADDRTDEDEDDSDRADVAMLDSSADDSPVVESSVDDTLDVTVTEGDESDDRPDDATEGTIGLAEAGTAEPADEPGIAETAVDTPIVGESSPNATSIDETDAAVAESNSSVDEEPVATAPDDQSWDDATVGDDSDESSTEDPDVKAVMPSPDADAPSRSEYEPAAISLKNDWSDYDFDFTPGSLARLDTFLDDQWAGRFRSGSLDDSDVDPDASGPLVGVGAYAGEVLIQHYDAQWVLGENGEPALAIPGRHGRTETFPVFDVSRTSLTENARIAYAVDALANRLDIETRASGAEETAFALGDEGPGTAVSAADVITTIVERAEDFVASWPGYDLNYRPASLVRLDNLAKDELDREAFRAARLGDRTDPDALRLADRAAGASAYFAAVLVRHLDAQWEIDDEVALSVEGPAGETRVVPFEGSVDCLRGEASFMRRYDVVHDAVIDESRSTG